MGIRDKILANKAKLTPVKVCGEDCYMKPISGHKRSEILNEVFRNRKAGMEGGFELISVRSKMIMLSLCDADGKRLFDDKDLDAFDESLASQNPDEIEQVFLLALKVNYLSREAVDEAEKN